MHRRTYTLLASVLLLAPISWLGFAAPAAASPPQVATGTFTTLSDLLTPFRIADGNIFPDEVLSLAYAGDLTGMATDTDTLVVHSDGSYEGHGTEVGTSVTLGGRTGGFTAAFVFRGSGVPYSGTLIFTGGTGGLAGLHGEGTFQGDAFGNQTYSYRYWFAP
jgi:hypothetical protein